MQQFLLAHEVIALRWGPETRRLKPERSKAFWHAERVKYCVAGKDAGFRIKDWHEGTRLDRCDGTDKCFKVAHPAVGASGRSHYWETGDGKSIRRFSHLSEHVSIRSKLAGCGCRVAAAHRKAAAQGSRRRRSSSASAPPRRSLRPPQPLRALPLSKELEFSRHS